MRTVVDTPRSMEREPSRWMEHGLLESAHRNVRASLAYFDAMTGANRIHTLRAVVRRLVECVYTRVPMLSSYVLTGPRNAAIQNVTTATCIVSDSISACIEPMTLSLCKLVARGTVPWATSNIVRINDHNGAHGATTMHSRPEGVLSVLRAYSSNQSTLVASEHTRTEESMFGLAV